MLIEYRKCICKHPIEWDASVIEKLYDAKQDKKTDLKTIRTEHIDYLKSVAKVTDIWKDGLSKIFTTNSLFFANPLYFINHLDKVAGVPEFNPYKGKSYKDIYNIANGVCEDIDMETKIFDNPGFAPVYDKEKGGIEVNNFAGTNGFYNQNYSHLPAYSTREYMYHEGVDFTGKKGTPIKSLIISEVVAWGWYGGYGKTMFMRNMNETGIYLLGHLSEYPKDIVKGKKYLPGETVAYMGGSGSNRNLDAWSPHLHLSYYNYKSNGRELSGNGQDITVINLNFKLTLRNPFNHNSEDWKGTKWKESK